MGARSPLGLHIIHSFGSTDLDPGCLGCGFSGFPSLLQLWENVAIGSWHLPCRNPMVSWCLVGFERRAPAKTAYSSLLPATVSGKTVWCVCWDVENWQESGLGMQGRSAQVPPDSLLAFSQKPLFSQSFTCVALQGHLLLAV